MKIVTLLTHKGGVGKTTFTYTLGAGLACKGYRVLMIDGDGQGTLTYGVGLKKKPALYDLVVRDADWGDVISVLPEDTYKANGHYKEGGSLWIIPGNAETMNMNKLENSRNVRSRLRELSSDVDVILIDTSPTPSEVHAGFYLATDFILYPTQPESYSTDSLMATIRFTDLAQQSRLDYGIADLVVAGILPNMCRDTTQHNEIIAKLRERFRGLVWEPIPLAIAWSDASTVKLPITTYLPKSPQAQLAWGMVERLEGAING